MRLFVAVWPPAGVLDAVEALDRPAMPGVRWTTRDQWHVTLHFLGKVDDVGLVVARVGEGLRPAGAGGGDGVVATVGPVTRQLGSSLVVLPVAGLAGLASEVVQATAGLGEPPPDRPFFGHLTLARVKRGVRPGGVVGLLGADVSMTWPVFEVTLVASHLHPQGARYEVVARFPCD